MATSGPPPEGGLRVSIKMDWRFDLPGSFENPSSSPFNTFLQEKIIREMWILKHEQYRLEKMSVYLNISTFIGIDLFSFSQSENRFFLFILTLYLNTSYLHVCMYMCAQSCPTLCNPTDCSPPGSSVNGIFQARTLEWVAISSSRGSSQPRDWTCISCVSGWILYHWCHLESPLYLHN